MIEANRAQKQNESYRRKLMAVARAYAEQLQQRPQAVGIVLYGSLARGGITDRSDIDMILIYTGELPPYFAEHRIVDQIKVDLIFWQIEAVRDLVVHPPADIYQPGWPQCYLLESFTLGGPDTILFDPTGEIDRVKRRFNELTDYNTLILPDARQQYHDIVTERIDAAVKLSEGGDLQSAGQDLMRAVAGFDFLLRMLTVCKDRKSAAEQADIPAFYETAVRLEQLFSPDHSAVKALWQAAQDLWDYCLEFGWRPMQAKLRRARAEEPEKIELIGDWPLFWGGYRLHELGRAIAEVALSLNWSRLKLDEGDPGGALDMLWACTESSATINRLNALQNALEAAGYDVADIVQPLLEQDAFQRLSAALDQANQAVTASISTKMQAAPQINQAIHLARDLQALISKAFPLIHRHAR